MKPSPLVFALLLVAGCKSSETTSAPASTSSVAAPTPSAAAPRPVAPEGSREAPLAVEVKTLLSEYADNEVRADGQFKGKLVQVSGTVGEVKKDITGSVYVTIGTGAQLEVPVVQCFVADDQVAEASALSKGHKVTVQGRVDGLMMNVLAKDCRINPMMQLCKKLQAAVGGKKCTVSDGTGDANGLVLAEDTDGKDGSIAALICSTSTATRAADDHYKAAVAKFSGDASVTVIGSESARCFGIFQRVGKKTGPLPEDVLTKARSFFAAL